MVQAVGGYRQASEREPRRPYLWHELARLYLDLERPQEAAAAFARSIEQLPGTRWPALHAAFAGVAREPLGGDVPQALDRVPEDGSVAGGDGFTTLEGGAGALGGAQDINALVSFLSGYKAPAAPYDPSAVALRKPRIVRLP